MQYFALLAASFQMTMGIQKTLLLLLDFLIGKRQVIFTIKLLINIYNILMIFFQKLKTITYLNNMILFFFSVDFL